MNLAYILSLLLALLISACSKPLDSEKKFISKVYAKLIDIKYEIKYLEDEIYDLGEVYSKFASYNRSNSKDASKFDEYVISFKHELEWAYKELNVLKNEYKKVDIDSEPVRRNFHVIESTDKMYLFILFYFFLGHLSY